MVDGIEQFEGKKKRPLWAQLNVFSECREQGLLLTQCPSFLMILMGIVTIGAMLTTYFIAIRYTEPEFVVLILSVETVILMIIGHTTVQSFERIAEANRMKTEFISITSHQLRTPLTSLKWSLNLLLGERLGHLNKKQHSYLETIEESSERMIDLVNDLLNVSRIEQGRFGIRPVGVDMAALLRDLTEELQPFAQLNDIRIVLDVDSTISTRVVVDPDRIRMALQNLIDNAIKYSHPGGTVAVHVQSSPKGSGVRILVEDHGVGIPADQQHEVFAKFFRAQNVIKRKTEGTGLGLFITHSIVDLHGGRISFISQEDEGTTFVVDLLKEGRFRKSALLAPAPGRRSLQPTAIS